MAASKTAPVRHLGTVEDFGRGVSRKTTVGRYFLKAM
jgi:hypothetical protein